MLATWLRLLPTTPARASWVRPKREISEPYAMASSTGFRSARWTFSMMATSITSTSSMGRSMIGTLRRRAAWAARQRRSPAMICHIPSSPGWARTRMGCSTPLSRIEAVSSSRFSALNCLRGWSGLGFRLSIGTARTPVG
ncbi:hypothetical protein D3C85_1255420 [compost metagenome]